MLRQIGLPAPPVASVGRGDRVMLYAKGGVAWAGDKYQQTYPPLTNTSETSVTRPGWTAGGGLEWAFWNNSVCKVEYNLYNFDTRNLAFPGRLLASPKWCRLISKRPSPRSSSGSTTASEGAAHNKAPGNGPELESFGESHRAP